LWRFLLALEFKQIIEPNSKALLAAGRAINAETAPMSMDCHHELFYPAELSASRPKMGMPAAGPMRFAPSSANVQ
jgi:hypothetical protein